MATWRKVIVSGSDAELNTLQIGGGSGGSGVTLSTVGAVTADAAITAGSSFIIGSADINETDLEKLDGITNGTAAANKAVVLDGSKNIATIGTIGCGAITSTGTSTFATACSPDAVGGADLGSTGAEWGDIYIADDKSIKFGNDQDVTIEYDENGTDELRFAGNAVTFEQAVTFDGAVTLGNATGDSITVLGNSTFSGTTIANLGTVSAATSITSTAFVGPIDGIVGGNTPAAGTFTSLVATGDVDLGDATSDTITATGRFDSDLVPSTDSARDLGTSTLQFAEAHIDTGYIDAITNASAVGASHLTGSFTGSFVGDGSSLTGVAQDIDSLGAYGAATLHQTQDKFLVSDNGTEKSITFSNLQDSVFADITGDIAIAAGGAATIQANSVALTTDTTGDYIATITGGTGIDSSASGEGAATTLTLDLSELTTETTLAQDDFIPMVDTDDSSASNKITFSNFEDEIFGNITGDIAIAAGGAATIQANSVALSTDTTGNYVATVTGGTGIDSDGATTGEGIAHSLTLDLNELGAETSIDQADFVAMVDATDDGSQKITFSNFEDEIFGNVSGDVAIAAGGAATIQATSVEGSMLNDNVISGQGALGGVSMAQADLLLIDDGPGTLKIVTFSNFEDSIFGNVSGDIAIAAGGAATVTGATTNAALTAGSGLTSAGTFNGATARTFSVNSGSMAAYFSSSAFSKVSGDIVIASTGVAAIQANSVALSTDTTGNYVLDVTVGTGLGGAVASEGGTAAMSLDAAQTVITSVKNASLVIGRDADNDIDFTTDNNIRFRAGGEDQLTLTNGFLTPSSNAIVDLGTDDLEFKDLWIDGTAYLDSATITGGTITGITDLAVADGGTGASTLNNLITMGTHTTGNYVATVADSGGGGITVANSGAESAAITLELDINGLTTDSIASGDFIAFSDENESGDPANKETIDDVATLFAGDGLQASSAVMAVDVSDFAGTGLEDDSSENLRLATQGTGISGGNGSTLSITPGQTAITSVYNTALILGSAASQEYVTFGTSNQVNTFIDNSEVLSVTSAGIEVTGNATISGNLTVNGTQTTISSSVLDIGDNIIQVNGTPVTYGGIQVKDVTSNETGSMVWNSTSNYWVAGLSGSEYRVPIQNTVSNLSDNKVVLAQGNGRIESSANITDDGSTVDFNDVDLTSLDKLEGVDTNTYIDLGGSTLIVTKGTLQPYTTGGNDLGATGTRYANLWLSANADLEGDIDVNGTANLDVTDIDGTLDVAGIADFQARVDAQASLQVTGSVYVSAGASVAAASASLVSFRNDSNTQLGYLASADTQAVTTGLVGYNTSTGNLTISSVIDGGSF